MDTPIVISYDNAPTENTKYFINTLESNGWGYKIVGTGETWEGWPTRMRAYSKILGTLPDDKVVILSDARDVVCVRSPKAFMDGFRKFNKDMVVSMELLCGGIIDNPTDAIRSQCKPVTNYWKHNNITTIPPRRYVNNGLVAGKAKALKVFMDWIIEHKFQEDQLGLGNYVNTFPDRVALDVEAEILHTTTFGVNAGILSIHTQKHDSPTFAEFFGRGAFFLHIPGIQNKGQAVIYEYVKKMIDAGARCNILSGAYKYKEPVWNEIF
jgi:hypothetical protein